MAERFELGLYRHAAGVTAQSNETVDSITRRSPSTPAAVITNGVDPNRFGARCGDMSLLGPEPGPVFVYAGLLGLAQGLDQVLDLAKSLPAASPGRIVLVGDGPKRSQIEERIRAESIDRVKLLPAQPRASIPALLAAADVALVSLEMRLPGAVPSKIYEAMASSLPILGIVDGEAARRILDAHCGLVVRPGYLPGLVRAFCQLADDASLRRKLGAAGRRAAETVYDRAAIACQLDDFLRSRLSASDGTSFRGVQRVDNIPLTPKELSLDLQTVQSLPIE
jgi:glycosyltransferase involved in cell wall biosynthesis